MKKQKQRFCKYCEKDITADWPHLKNICDNPKCREKQRLNKSAETRRRNRMNYEKRKINQSKGRVCDNCGIPIPVEQDIRRPICLSPECAEWWKAEKYRRKLKKQNAWYHKNKSQVVEVEKPVKIKAEDLFSQSTWEKEQMEIRSRRRVCMAEDCDRLTNGVDYYCDKHQSRIYAKASSGNFSGGEGRAHRAFCGVV